MVILDRDDSRALDAAADSWERIDDPTGWVNLVLHGYRLPAGLVPSSIDLLIRLPSQFPDAAPDMFWVIPDVTRVGTGTCPPNTEVHEPYLGRTWQRFSRHLQPGAWQVGVDGIPSWLATIGGSFRADVA